jgi:hypothetical protein
MNLDTVTNLFDTYRMASWRVQRQWIVTFLLVIVSLAMVAALYLDVTARAAIAGREIQSLNYQISAMQQANSDLETRLASLTSVSVMAQRAQALGFRSMSAGEVEYLAVPGYVAPQPEILSAVPQTSLSAPSVPPEYTQSLLDWFDQALRAWGETQ